MGFYPQVLEGSARHRAPPTSHSAGEGGPPVLTTRGQIPSPGISVATSAFWFRTGVLGVCACGGSVCPVLQVPAERLWGVCCNSCNFFLR